jgi:hypothetical protein
VQLRDVVGILEVRRGELDLDYVERWIRELNLVAAWELVRSRAGI